jgi:hypothetical protein
MVDILTPLLTLIFHSNAAMVALHEQDKVSLKRATGIAI